MSSVLPDSASQAAMYSTPLTKSETAYHQIRKEIVEGVLAPDTVLDQEALAIRLGLSTTPVREALRMLESENLVVSRRHRNMVVAPLDFELLEETYAVRMVLDPLAVELAAANATIEDRETISKLAHQSVEKLDPRAVLHANRALHRAVYAASGNSVLTGMLDALWDRSDRYRMVTLHNDTNTKLAHDEHNAIVMAVLARDGVTAAALMHAHVADSLHRIREMVSGS